MTLRVMHVVGARPNYMKTAPIMARMRAFAGQIDQVLVHTGQHYDGNMSGVFFEELGLGTPDEFLGVGSGTHAEQTAHVMLSLDPVVVRYRPDWLMVVGDVNSTLACALVAAKRGVRVAHVEAGLRSRDRTMPEELNRLLTDQLADLLLTPSRDANENLLRENIPPSRIEFVGNVMIDTLVQMLPAARQRTILADLKLAPRKYCAVTLHRPFNVDHLPTLREILQTLGEIAESVPVVFAAHPRTRKRIDEAGLDLSDSRIHLLEPLGYLDCLALTDSARFVLTDSGGLQEETTYLGVPCLTLRPNTERPVTITEGTNRLVESTRSALLRAVDEVLSEDRIEAKRPELWDGNAAERIVNAVLAHTP
jgi:UDP-N-acetylglucosamine 2-epimerase (non-hydrolysing)